MPSTVHSVNGVEYLTFPLFEKETWLHHAFSTRIGGVSEGEFATMNFSFDREKKRENVLENFRRFSEAAGFPMEKIVYSDQTHTTNLMKADRTCAGAGITREKFFRDVDGMFTKEEGLVLSTYYADCVPLFFADPVHRAIALSHSGWKGTADQMAICTIERMKKEFGSDPKDLLCVIGPSICRDCYEVGPEVACHFPKEAVSKGAGDRFHLDLWKANALLLQKGGLLPEHIELPDLCTCCNPDYLFSHRASGGRRGLLGAFLMIREGQGN